MLSVVVLHDCRLACCLLIAICSMLAVVLSVVLPDDSLVCYMLVVPVVLPDDSLVCCMLPVVMLS